MAKMTEEEKKERDLKKQKKKDEEQLERQLHHLIDDFSRATVFGTPTRSFEPSELVVFGHHDHTCIEKCHYQLGNRTFYLIRSWKDKITEANKLPNKHWVGWWGLQKLKTSPPTPRLSVPDGILLSFQSRDVNSLLHMHYSGIDYEPEYQRGHVWQESQRVALINSIFHNIDIGKFAMIDRGYLEKGPMKEILDGKQRITTLVMFFEDRLRYKSKFFSDLCRHDQRHFRNCRVSYAEGREGFTREQKLRYFLKLNTAGSPQDEKHLQHVAKMLHTNQ